MIGIKTKDGVVLAVEKPIHSRLLKAKVNRRIQMIDSHVGAVGAGLAADCRAVVERARQEAASHRENFEDKISGGRLADRVALYMQAYTLYASVRPFGCTMLVAAVDKDGPHLHMIEPSGVMWSYKCCVAGKGRQTARSELEKLNVAQLSMVQAVNEAARILYKAHDENKDKDFELEISWIGPDSGNEHQLVPESVLQQAIAYGKAALDDTQMQM